MRSFSECLKLAMAQANMTQTTLADESGFSKAAISQYLSGKNTPSTARVEILANILKVSPTFLMGLDGPKLLTPPVTNIGTRQAARCLGKSEQFVRIGLQRGLLPFGNAVPGTGKKFNYYINPLKFRDYVGPERFDEFFHIMG